MTSRPRDRVLDAILPAAPILVGLALSCAYCFCFVHRGEYVFAGSDPYYYISIADGLLEGGPLAVRTSEPSHPVLTPQNGMVIVYALLRSLGLGAVGSVLAVTLVHHAVWVSALYPFLRLVECAGIRGYWPKAALTVGFLAAGHLLDYQLIAATDGLYNAASIWWVFLVHRVVFEGSEGDPAGSSRLGRIAMWTAVACLPALAIHFRVNTLINLAAAGLSVACLAGSWHMKRRAGAHIVVVTALALASFLVVYRGIDTSGIASSSALYGHSIRANLSRLGYFLFRFSVRHLTRMLPQAYAFAFVGFALLCAGVGFWRRRRGVALAALGVLACLLAILLLPSLAARVAVEPANRLLAHTYALAILGLLAFCMWVGWWERRSLLAFLALVLLGSMAFVVLIPGRQLILAGPRYIISTLPFLWLLAMSFRWTRPLAYAALAVVAWDAGSYVLSGDARCGTPPHFYQYVLARGYRLPTDAVLATQQPRESYAFLGGRHQTRLCAALRPGVERVWVVGDEAFRSERVAELRSCPGWRVASKRVVTAEFRDELGNAILELRVRPAGHDDGASHPSARSGPLGRHSAEGENNR